MDIYTGSHDSLGPTCKERGLNEEDNPPRGLMELPNVLHNILKIVSLM